MAAGVVVLLLWTGASRAHAADWLRSGVEEATAYARGAAAEYGGEFSFAVADSCGRVKGYEIRRPNYSASAVKAMLLVAFLRLPDVRERALSAEEIAQLEPMITESANSPALWLYEQIGDAGLAELAAEVGMDDFAGGGSYGWGAVQASARDWIRFYQRLRRSLPALHEEWAMGLFSSIAPEQSWGIAFSVPSEWTLFFKGGWIPTADGWIVTQNGRLERGSRAMAISVLTQEQPSYGVGVWHLGMIGHHLLGGYDQHRRPTCPQAANGPHGGHRPAHERGRATRHAHRGRHGRHRAHRDI